MAAKSVTCCLNELFDRPFETTATSLEWGASPLVPDINFSSAYAYCDEDTLAAYHEDKHSNFRYARDSNSLVLKLEQIFSHIFSGKSILFSSGMSAIWSVLWSSVNDVDCYITIGSFYRKSLVNIEQICKLTGRTHLNFPDLNSLLNSNISSRPLILLESPSNPFLRLIDVRIVRDTFPNAILLYDNTMAGLLNDVNSELGADFIVTSCTKYIGGHNDVLGGIVTTTDANNFKSLWEIRSSQGGILDPFAAFLIFRSLKTYDVRMSRILENIEPVLHALDSHKHVNKLYYPGRFSNIDQQQIADKCYRHGAGVITFEVSHDVNLSFSDQSLHSSKMAPSFGSTDTLIERPATMSHFGKSEQELQNLGLSTRTVRLSVGMEPPGYIIADLHRLLSNE